ALVVRTAEAVEVSDEILAHLEQRRVERILHLGIVKALRKDRFPGGVERPIAGRGRIGDGAEWNGLERADGPILCCGRAFHFLATDRVTVPRDTIGSGPAVTTVVAIMNVQLS